MRKKTILVGLGSFLAACSGGEGLQVPENQLGDRVVESSQLRVEDEIARNAHLEEENNLLTRLYIGNRAIEWYQPRAGVFVVSEVGVAGHEAPLLMKPDLGRAAPEIFANLAPELPVPEVLRAIHEEPTILHRQVNSRQVEVRLPPETVQQNYRLLSGFEGYGGGGCTQSWVQNEVCTLGGWDNIHCRLNRWGEYFGTCTDREDVAQLVCAVDNDFRTDFFVSENSDSSKDGAYGSVVVGPGFWRWNRFVAYSYPWPLGDDAFNVSAGARSVDYPFNGTFHHVLLCEHD